MALSAKAQENVTVPTSSMQKLGMTEDKEMKEFVEETFFGFDDWDDENPLWTEEDEQNLKNKK